MSRLVRNQLMKDMKGIFTHWMSVVSVLTQCDISWFPLSRCLKHTINPWRRRRRPLPSRLRSLSLCLWSSTPSTPTKRSSLGSSSPTPQMWVAWRRKPPMSFLMLCILSLVIHKGSIIIHNKSMYVQYTIHHIQQKQLNNLWSNVLYAIPMLYIKQKCRQFHFLCQKILRWLIKMIYTASLIVT